VAICDKIWRENDVVRREKEVLMQILEGKHSMSPELAVLMVLNLKQIYSLVIKMSRIYKDISGHTVNVNGFFLIPYGKKLRRN
jgi:hypothetical protein